MFFMVSKLLHTVSQVRSTWLNSGLQTCKLISWLEPVCFLSSLALTWFVRPQLQNITRALTSQMKRLCTSWVVCEILWKTCLVLTFRPLAWITTNVQLFLNSSIIYVLSFPQPHCVFYMALTLTLLISWYWWPAELYTQLPGHALMSVVN